MTIQQEAMMRNARNSTLALAASACLTLSMLAGCQTVKDNPRATGTAAGAGAGALTGSAIAGKGHKTEGALIGGAVGAGGGWLAADQIDKHSNDDNDKDKARRREADRTYDDASYRTRQPDPYDRF
jgi:uncharacterized protein YcfJ